MAVARIDLPELLRLEEQLLERAVDDIRRGEERIHRQDDRVRELRAGGRPIREAERLAELMRQTLSQWERHRVLIEQRVAYLHQQVEREARPRTSPRLAK